MRRCVAVLVLIAFLSVVLQHVTSSLALAANQEPPSYKRGKEAGQKAANKDTEVLWSVIDFAYGFTLGPIAVGHSLISNYILKSSKLPDERKRQIDHRRNSYQEGYQEGYRQTKGRNKLAIRATGWIGWIGTWAILDQMRQ